MNKLFVIFTFLALMVSLKTFAKEPKADDFRFGVITGNVGLLKDVGDTAGNAIGVGAVMNYNLVEEFFFEGSYVQSDHDNLDNQSFSLGVGQYFESYETMYFYGAAGILFATNELTISNENIKDTGFGLYGGAGLDIFTSKKISFGLQARYNKIFEQEKSLSGGQKVKVVQDFYTVLFKVQYIF